MINEELIKKAKLTTKDLSGNGLLNEKQSNMFINFAILLAIKNQYLFRNVEKKMTKLYLLNFILLQWFCMRLTRKCEEYDSTKAIKPAPIVIVNDYGSYHQVG